VSLIVQLAANAAKLGADPKQGFIVGGSSAGGNISAVMALLARDTKLSPPLTGAWLYVPATIHDASMPEKYRSIHTSYEQNGDAPMLGKREVVFLTGKLISIVK
jgi:acetyl esterase/lipase